MRTRRGFLRLLAGLPLLAVLPWRKTKPPKIRPSSVKVKYCPAYDLGEWRWNAEVDAATGTVTLDDGSTLTYEGGLLVGTTKPTGRTY